MLVASFVLIDAGTPFPSAWALLPVLGTAAVILGGELAPDGTLTGALGAGPMRYVGERSFGFYLWHQPFLVLPALALGSLALPGRLALLSLGFAAAVVTYELVENPVRHARRLARAVPLTLGVGGGLVAAGLVVTLGAQTLGKVEVQQTQVSAVEELPSPAEARRAVADSVGMQALPDDLSPPAAAIAEQGSLAPEEAACDRDYDVTQADLCLLGDPAGERTMVLWGDSHASMWAPGLSALAEQQGIRLAVFAKYGCAPLLDVTPWHPVEDRAYPECAEFKESVVPLMLDLDPDQVVLTGAFKGWAYTENGRTRIDGGTYDSQGRWTQTDTVDDVWDAGLERTLEALDPTGAPVTVLGDSAYPGEDPTTCFVANGASLTECATPQETAVWDQHNDSEQATAEAAGAAYVSTTRWFCAEDTCPPVVGSIGVYRDGYHVTRQFSLHLARALGEAIGVLPRTYGNR